MNLSALQILFARIWAPISWRSERVIAHRLLSFAEAEHISRMMLLQAAEQTLSPERKAEYLDGASDEARHTRIFLQQAQRIRSQFGESPPFAPQGDAGNLFADLGEARFLALLHHGEARVMAQFMIYRDFFARRKKTKLARAFAIIVEEEAGHQGKAWQMLLEVSESRKDAVQDLRWVQRWELRRSFRRLAQRNSAFISKFLMLLLYPLLALVAFPLRRVARNARRSIWSERSQ